MNNENYLTLKESLLELLRVVKTHNFTKEEVEAKLAEKVNNSDYSTYKQEISAIVQSLRDTDDGLKDADNKLNKLIEDINKLIPDTANSENKLTDTTFVNDSIDTAITAVNRTIDWIKGLIPENTSATNKLVNTYEMSAEIKNITDLIPNTAAQTNQLADKAFVSSSVATSTATFKGTYTNIEDFPTSGVDENDYIYYDTFDEVGNRQFNRYKYSGSAWEYEYTLNNSSFTAEQWAAINSGITDSIIESILQEIDNNKQSITELSSDISDVNTGLLNHVADHTNPHNVTKSQVGLSNVENYSMDAIPTESSNNYVRSSGVFSAIKTVNDSLTSHKNDTSNPHSVTKTQVGLGKVEDLTVDSDPTKDSENYVRSGGVFNALDKKVDKIEGKGLSTVDFTDTNYVHTDNNYTAAEKNKLAGIEAGAQVNSVTGVKGSSETSYRTGNISISKDNIGLGNVDNTSDIDKPISKAAQQGLNKSLYNLGAFDTYPTIENGVANYKKVTRQTGYLTINSSDIIDKIVPTDRNTSYILTTIVTKDVYEQTYGEVVGISSNGYSVRRVGAYWLDNLQIGLHESDAVSISNVSFTSVDQYKALCPIQIQYKLATSYTEEIIEGQPLITLDSQGSQWLRSEWEKGLNLLDFSVFGNGQKEFSTSGNTGSQFVFEVWADDQYQTNVANFRIHTDGSNPDDKTQTIPNSGLYYCRIGINGNAQDAKTNLVHIYLEKGTYTFSGVFTTFEANHIVYDGLMLNEGDNAYPYQPYNSKAHITNYDADFLKDESLKSANLFDYNSTFVGELRDGVLDPSHTTWWSSDFIKVKPNNNYAFSGADNFIFYYDTNKNYINKQNGLSYYTTPNNCYYVRINGLIETQPKENVMFNKGAEALPYQEYNGSIVREKQLNEKLNETLNNKVDKVSGKGLSTNDYTTAEKNKLSSIENGAEVNDVNSVNGKTGVVIVDSDDISDTNKTHKFVTDAEKATWNAKQAAISDLETIRAGASAGASAVQPNSLAAVATSGSYNDLSNKPNIPTVPTNVSAFTNDAGYDEVPTFEISFHRPVANGGDGKQWARHCIINRSPTSWWGCGATFEVFQNGYYESQPIRVGSYSFRIKVANTGDYRTEHIALYKLEDTTIMDLTFKVVVTTNFVELWSLNAAWDTSFCGKVYFSSGGVTLFDSDSHKTDSEFSSYCSDKLVLDAVDRTYATRSTTYTKTETDELLNNNSGFPEIIDLM